MPVIDASVYLAVINTHEPGHARAAAWFNYAIASQTPLHAPVIVLSEVAGPLSRGLGGVKRAHQAIQQLVSSPLISLTPISLPLAQRAAEIAADYRLRGCDAVYVALAEQLGDELVTLDQEQLQRGGAVVTTRQP